MPIVVTTPLVDRKLDELFEALLEKDYFSDEENAYAYCNGIRAFIKSLATQKGSFTINKQWGTFFAVYKANRRTTWYITFDIVPNRGYLVRNLFNNHTEEYPLFIAG